LWESSNATYLCGLSGSVAAVLLVEGDRVHDVVVLGVRLDLVVDHYFEAVVLYRLDDFVHEIGAAQAGGHHQASLEAELERLWINELMAARTEQRPGNG